MKNDDLEKMARECANVVISDVRNEMYPATPVYEEIKAVIERATESLRSELEKARKQFGLCSVCGFLAWEDDKTGNIERCQVCQLRTELAEAQKVAGWAQALLTGLNVGDVRSGSALHLKLREVMIAYRAAIDAAMSAQTKEGV